MLGVLPVLSSSVLTYAGVVISGPSIGPVLLLTLLSFSYYLLGVPLEPSFKSNFAARNNLNLFLIHFTLKKTKKNITKIYKNNDDDVDDDD